MVALVAALAILYAPDPGANSLPGRYYRLMEAGIARVETRLERESDLSLKALETQPGFRHFPSVILVAAVLYTRPHAANSRRGDGRLLELAVRIGDLLVAEQTRGTYTARLDHHRDTYMWLEAYRLLEGELGDNRRERWRQALLEILGRLAADVAERKDFPAYRAPFIITSPNHYSLWTSTLLLGGRVFRIAEWEKLAASILHRFAADEQAPDGFWGEHSSSGPTTGYDYLTVAAIALYWEHTKDPAALAALRRSTDFHKYFTYPDGAPVETINDRNRYWTESVWGHFGFSHFADGRRYSEFLTGFHGQESLDLESLGRIAQNALYYHEGKTSSIPQDNAGYYHRMKIPAGIRKTGPWVVCLSGIIDTPVVNRFFLDRQAHLSVFHLKTGLIITGANSKRQPELATFAEKIGDRAFHMPVSSGLSMNERGDNLSLGYNSFFAVLEMPPASRDTLGFRFLVTPTNPGADRLLTLQVVLKSGLPLETGAGRKFLLDEKRVALDESDLGGSIRHNGWVMRLPAGGRLLWPVYPFNPYSDGPETDIRRAVAALSIPIRFEPRQTGSKGFFSISESRREIPFSIEVPR